MNQFLRIIGAGDGDGTDMLINIAKISMIQSGASDSQTSIWLGTGDRDDYEIKIDAPFDDVSRAIIDNIKSASIITISEL